MTPIEEVRIYWFNARDGAASMATVPTGTLGNAIRDYDRVRAALAHARQVLSVYQPDSAPAFYMEAIWEAEAALDEEEGIALGDLGCKQCGSPEAAVQGLCERCWEHPRSEKSA